MRTSWDCPWCSRAKAGRRLDTIDGIAELGGMKSAWLVDSEGNIIAIGQLPS